MPQPPYMRSTVSGSADSVVKLPQFRQLGNPLALYFSEELSFPRSLAMNEIELETRYCAHNYEPLLVVLARGQGATLWDTAGRQYVDMLSAYSAAGHGHGHPRILAALE
jgi:hypothetical protein